MFPINLNQMSELLGAWSDIMTLRSGCYPQLHNLGAEILDAAQNVDIASDNCPVMISAATIDSRVIRRSQSVESGPAFFAVAGEKTHGASFAESALERGAACVISDRPVKFLCDSERSSIERLRRRIFCVPSSIQALQTLGAWNRKQFSGLCIGVTGSVGKTTTRQMIHDVLSINFCGVQSPKNFNNELGVPLTLCELNPEHDFCVVEMGAGRPGDIAALAKLAVPEFGVVTRVAPAHLSSMGSIEHIQQTKQELIESLPSFGHAFLNVDDPNVRSMSMATRANVTLFGTSTDADVRAKHVHFRNGVTRLTVDGTQFEIQGGSHLVTSALAAIAVGRLTGIQLSSIADAIRSFQPDAGRGRIVATAPWTIVDDSYNASPASVAACIQNLSDWSDSVRRILVLGDMLELGDASDSLHREIGQRIAESRITHTLLFGANADTVASSAKAHGISQNRISVFRDMQTLNLVLDCLVREGDVVWVKGSRAVAMERVIEHLMIQQDHDARRAA